MAPRLSRLASTISRDDIIVVIGASSPPCSGPPCGRSVCFGLRPMEKLCQQSPLLPSLTSLTEIVDFVIDLKFAPRQRKRRQTENGEEVMTITQRDRSEEHTSELQSLRHLVCRLLLEKKKK